MAKLRDELPDLTPEERLQIFHNDAVDELRTCRWFCLGYFISVAIFYYPDIKLPGSVVFSGIFVLCLLGILSFRIRNALDRHRMRKSCIALGIIILFWGVYVLYSWYKYSFFVIFLLCILVPGLAAYFFREKFIDAQTAYIAYLGYNVLLFFFLFVLRLRWLPLHFLIALWIKKDMDSLRKLLADDQWGAWYIQSRTFFALQLLSVCALGIDLYEKTPMPFDVRLPFYAMTSWFLEEEILFKVLAKRYEAFKRKLTLSELKGVIRDGL